MARFRIHSPLYREDAAHQVTAGGSVKIVDRHNFPITGIAAAIVTVKPWRACGSCTGHPNADEWQYYVKGTARMTVFTAGTHARTMDFHAGDVGYIEQSQPHYIENIGDNRSGVPGSISNCRIRGYFAK